MEQHGTGKPVGYGEAQNPIRSDEKRDPDESEKVRRQTLCSLLILGLILPTGALGQNDRR